MVAESLSKISTQWTQMEALMDIEGPAALANYLAAHYFEPLARIFKKYRRQLDDLAAHELASEVFYEFIKNDYSGVHRLDRNKGHLRGLFFKIARAKLSNLGQKYESLEEFEERDGKEVDSWVNIYLDIEGAVEKLKQQRPKLYPPFVAFYLEGKSIAEIAQSLGLQENAIKQRLFSARQWMTNALREYQNEGEKNRGTGG